MKKFLPDERFASAPQLPRDRPPTRREVWERYHFLHFDLKPHEETPGCTERCARPPSNAPDQLVPYCKSRYIEAYITWFNNGWRKQPDWREGDLVIPSRVPEHTFWAGETGDHTRTIYACLERRTG